MSTFRELVTAGAAALGLPLEAETLDRLFIHQQQLARWAPRVNLVGDARLHVTAERHFIDSLALLRLLPDAPLVDVGAGAGFPGLVIAAARPSTRVVLLEPLAKRASFLGACKGAMGLRNVEVRIERLESLGPRSQSLLVSRAVLAPAAWLRAAAPLLAASGRVVTMATAEPGDDEREAAREAGLTLEASDAFVLPESSAPRVNTLWRLA